MFVIFIRLWRKYLIFADDVEVIDVTQLTDVNFFLSIRTSSTRHYIVIILPPGLQARHEQYRLPQHCNQALLIESRMYRRRRGERPSSPLPILFKALQSCSLLLRCAIDNRGDARRGDGRGPARLGNTALIADELRLVNWRAEKGAIGFLINLVGITSASPLQLRLRRCADTHDIP